MNAMKHFAAVLLLAVLVSGCSDGDGRGRQSVGKPEAPMAAAPRDVSVAEQSPAEDSAQRFMAYEHSIDLQVENDTLMPTYKAIESACLADTAEACVILSSSIASRGRVPYATITLRAKPAGVRKIIASLNQQGHIEQQTVRAEDLAGPIGDTAKRLKMLQEYRTQLELLRARAGASVESLITVNKELAEVQSEIESLSGEQAHLYQRVNTERLTISLSSTSEEAPFWRPISAALQSFKADLGSGIGVAIKAVAYMGPLVILLLFLIGWFRRLRRRKKEASF